MPSTVIYHNPQCSKSRKTLQLLQDCDIEPTIIEYLKTPPTVKEINQILTLLGLEPRQLIRSKDPLYKELGLDNTALSNQELIQTMTEQPALIERPIVIHNNRAVIGRPPENILTIL